MNEILIQKRIESDYAYVENLGYKVLGVFLQGSQNYELDYEGSDIDTKCIVLPSFEEFCLNKKPVSTTLVLPSNEHIDLKDIRLMFECFKKQNINFVEILFTQYKKINPIFEELYRPMLENSEEIAHYNNYAFFNCMTGMCMEKYKALEHPYPTLIEKIEKFGYDPKQLHHIERIDEFMTRYKNGESYRKCLISKKKEHLIDVKRGFYSLEEARRVAKEKMDNVVRMKDDYMINNPPAINEDAAKLLNSVLIAILKRSFMLEIGE